MTTLQEILDAAQSLPSDERAQLFYALWDTIEAEDWAPPSEDWLAEVNRRSDAYEAGKMTASPWREIRTRVRREVGLDE